MEKKIKIGLIGLLIFVVVSIAGLWILQSHQVQQLPIQPSETKYLTIKELLDNMDFYNGKEVTLRVEYVEGLCENLQKLFPEIGATHSDACFKDNTGEIYIRGLYSNSTDFPRDKEIIVRGTFNVMRNGKISYISVVNSNVIE